MEVELANQIGVSRTPIREAIRKLEKEGLVVIEPRRGAYASQISTKDMVEILEVRQNMERSRSFLCSLEDCSRNSWMTSRKLPRNTTERSQTETWRT